MSKKIIITIAFLLILSCLGCNKQSGIDTEVIEYHSGTDGLEMEFVKNLPPEKIIEGSDFVIGLELRNKGAYDIEQGRMLIYGFERGYVSVEQEKIEFNIEGKKPGFPEGGYEIVNFNAKNMAMPEIIKTYEAPFTARAYYRYNTEAATEVCINPNIYSYIETADITCKPETVKLSEGQGAPVAITKIEETFSPSGNEVNVDFIIYLENKGDGEVLGEVYIDEARIADEPLSCKIESIELEKDEEKSIVCSTKTKTSSGAYLTPIQIKLAYDYTTKLDKTIKISSLTKN